jgi:hypothetical protein
MLRTLFAIISAVFVVFKIAPPPSHTILRHRRGGGGGRRTCVRLHFLLPV